MNDNKGLEIQGVVDGSTQLNDVSSRLTEICTEMYHQIMNLRNEEHFVTQLASPEFFSSIDALNQEVPKFSEAILKFSKFLSDKILTSYEITDTELKNKIESNLSDSLAQIAALGMIGKAGLDFSKIATSAQGALNGQFVDSSKIDKPTFSSDQLEFFTREDGSIEIVRKGTTMGYTTPEGLNSFVQVKDGVERLKTEPTTEHIKLSTPSVSETPVPTSNSTNTIIPIQTDIPAGYSGIVHTKSQASAAIKESSGRITTGNRTYTVVPDNQYHKAPGTISQSDYDLLVSQTAGESGNSKDDQLAVVCTILNRLESGENFGDSITEVLEKGYFPWGETHLAYEPGGKYYNTEWGQEKLAQVKQVVDDALGGVRNLEDNVYYYSGNGKYNIFSDNV